MLFYATTKLCIHQKFEFLDRSIDLEGKSVVIGEQRGWETRKPFASSFVAHRCLRYNKLRIQVVLQQHLGGWSSSMHTHEALDKMDCPTKSWIDEGGA